MQAVLFNPMMNELITPCGDTVSVPQTVTDAVADYEQYDAAIRWAEKAGLVPPSRGRACLPASA
jgi:hypothetical protein